MADDHQAHAVTDAEARAINRRHWESRAAFHGEGGDAYYDVDRLTTGSGSLLDHEERALEEALGGRELADLDVVHVQCHIGFDAITLARRGARVVGYDFSATALAKARVLAERAGVDVTFVEADATAVPASLHDRFDLAWATIGVISWIRDLDAWMRQIAAVLRPGGRLVLVEIHPLYNMIESLDPFRVDMPYAYDGPQLDEAMGSYADPGADLTDNATVCYAHGLGEIITSAVTAGLRVVALHEHADVSMDPRGGVLLREADGRFRARVSNQVLPVLFTLIAER